MKCKRILHSVTYIIHSKSLFETPNPFLRRFNKLFSYACSRRDFHLAALGAASPRDQIRLFWRGLFERSEFPSHVIWSRGEVSRKGRAQANMVLGTFTETKVPRRAGAKPCIKLYLLTNSPSSSTLLLNESIRESFSGYSQFQRAI